MVFPARSRSSAGTSIFGSAILFPPGRTTSYHICIAPSVRPLPLAALQNRSLRIAADDGVILSAPASLEQEFRKPFKQHNTKVYVLFGYLFQPETKCETPSTAMHHAALAELSP